ncbi:hypothetical protein FFM54_30955 [Burkholderia pseudomallei]|nr:hypothetical protein FFM54_30955 [Burkholderia pseudomallei]
MQDARCKKQDARCKMRMPNAKRQTPNARRQTPDAGRRTPDAGRQTPNAGHQTPGRRATGVSRPRGAHARRRARQTRSIGMYRPSLPTGVSGKPAFSRRLRSLDNGGQLCAS